MASELSLLREKFTIRETGIGGDPVVALGNRLQIPLPKTNIPLVVRGHSMHITLRYCAHVLKQLSFISHVEKAETLMDWEIIWEKTLSPFEGKNVPNTWICVYYAGEIIYQSGYHHLFFDVIEHTEYKNIGTSQQYDKSIIAAQRAFRKMGRDVMIEQESHVGFILDPSPKEMRFAIILRTPEQKATFIVRMSENDKLHLFPFDYICLGIAADFIEGINMAVRAGFLKIKLDTQKAFLYSEDGKQFRLFHKRMQRLASALEQAEKKYKMLYRPEKPDFKLIIEQITENN